MLASRNQIGVQFEQSGAPGEARRLRFALQAAVTPAHLTYDPELGGSGSRPLIIVPSLRMSSFGIVFGGMP